MSFSQKNRAVFFDKDGVLNRDLGLMDNLNNYELFSSAAETIAHVREKGFKVFIVTNQAVVARGMISETELECYLKKFQESLILENPSAKVDRIYFCPHHPNADLTSYRKTCKCRKPKPGLLLRAAEEFNVDLAESFLVGDRISDIVAGNLAGCKTVQCMTEEYNSKLIETDLVFEEQQTRPLYQISEIGELRNYL